MIFSFIGKIIIYLDIQKKKREYKWPEEDL